MFAPTIFAYTAASFYFNKSSVDAINKIILEYDFIPTWNDKDRVQEGNNTFFYLDDDKGFVPSILYHGM